VASSNNPLVARYRQMAAQLVNPSGLSANLMPEVEASVAHK
jgi:hypothetical protein